MQSLFQKYPKAHKKQTPEVFGVSREPRRVHGNHAPDVVHGVNVFLKGIEDEEWNFVDVGGVCRRNDRWL